MKRVLISFLVVMMMVAMQSSYGQAYKLEKNWWQPNGSVDAIAVDTLNQVIYIGGSFTRIEPYVTNGVTAALTTRQIDYDSDMPNGVVTTSVSDGSGGWFIGGDFTKVGDSIRNRIAHIDSNGKVTSRARNFGANQLVRCIHMGDSGKIYVSGNFSHIGHLKPYGGMFVNNNDKPLLEFPQPNGPIEVIISDNNGGWYIGGSFTKVDDHERTGIAHIASNGKVSPFKIDISGSGVTALALTGNKLYFGGYFQVVNGVSRNRLAGVDITTNMVLPWNPNPNGTVRALVISGDTLYIGGQFWEIAGQPRMGLVAFSINSDSLLAWNPNLNSSVTSIYISGSNVFAGGYFTQVGDSIRNNIACIDAVTGIATNWKPSVNGVIWAIKPDGNQLLIGGSFTTVNNQSRQHLASLDMITGNVGTLSVGIQDSMYSNAKVTNIEVLPTELLIAGDFTHVGAQPLQYLAKIDKNTSLVSSWNPKANSAVKTIFVQGNQIFIGGSFSSIGGDKRGRLAAYNTVAETLTNWNPVVDYEVYSMQSDNNLVYLGGSFASIGGVIRNNLAAVDKGIGVATPWNPNVNGIVQSLLLHNDTLYIGGQIASIDNSTRNNLASFNILSGALTSWYPDVNGSVSKIKHYDSLLFVGGSFSQINTFPRSRIGAFKISDGTLSSWQAGIPSQGCNDFIKLLDTLYVAGGDLYGGAIYPVSLINSQPGASLPTSIGTVLSLTVSGNKVFAGGNFARMGGEVRSNLAAISMQTRAPTSFNAGTNHTVRSLYLTDSLLYIGGEFSHVNYIARNRIAALNKNTGLLTAWNPNLNSFPTSIIEVDTLVYIAGYFTTVKGQPRSYLAAVGKTLGNPTPFNPSINGVIHKIVKRDSLLFIAGQFTTINVQPRNHLAALNLSGVLTNWNPDVDGVVLDIAMHDSLLFLGGSFNNVGGKPRSNLAAVSVYNDSALIWTPSVDNMIYSIDYSDSLIFIAGNFSTINDMPGKTAAIFKADSINPTMWTPGILFGLGRAIRKFDNKVLLGGSFFSVGGHPIGKFTVFSRECYTTPSTEVVIACDSYQWINGVTYYASTAAPTYTLVNAGGCDSVINLHLTIIHQDTAVIQNGPILTATATATAYQWLDCNQNFAPIPGQTSAIFVAVVNGSYAVELTQGFCIDTSECKMVSDIGLNRVFSNPVRVYPNPTENELFVEIHNNSIIAEIELYTPIGQRILREYPIAAERCSVKLPPEEGFYLLRVITADGTVFTTKVVKI